MEGRTELARWAIVLALGAAGFFAAPFVLPAAGAPAATPRPVTAPSGWSPAAPFDFGGSGNQHMLGAVSCPSSGLCVGVDSNGDAVTSTDPTAATPTWSVNRVWDGYSLSGISCPSTSLCVAAGGQPGFVSITTDPADGASAVWTNTDVDGHAGIYQVSCPSASLCMAIDAADVLTTADPADPTPTWTVNNVEKPTDPNAGTLAGISCPTATFCAAVDESGRVLISADPDEGSQANWVPISVVPGSDGFSSISCPSAGLCVALDRQGDAVTSTNPGLFDVATWTFANIDAIGNHVGPVSCTSSTLCVAGDGKGNILTTSDPTDGSAAKWRLVNADPPNRVYGIGSPNAIGGISCDPSSSFCVATDRNGHALASTNPTGDASAWTITQADSDVDFQSNFPLAVSCGSNSFCAAVDGRGNVLTTTDPANGAAASWNVVLSLDQDVFTAISCPSTSLCVAAEWGGLVLSSTDPTAAAPTWTYSTAAVVPVSFLNSLSCPSTSLCVAAGDSGNIGISTDPADPASWTSTNIDGNIALHGVSCSSNTFCAAVDDHNDILTSTDPSVGASWAMTAVNVVNFDNGTHLEAISCASTSLCVALEGGYGNDIVVSSDPHGDASNWTSIIANTGLIAVSCPSNSFCVAAGQGAANAGELFTSTNPTGYAADWNATTIDSNDDLRGVSCPSVGMCLAVGSGGYFTRALASPSASTAAASSVTGTAATLNGTVEPNGWDVSGCRFDYGTSPGALDSSVPCDVSLPIQGKSTDVSVSAGLSGLTPGTTYYFRLVATTSLGAKSGAVQQFTAGSATTTTTTTTEPQPPALSGLGVAPGAFRTASSGAAIGGSSGGSRVSYRDTQAAATKFVVQHELAGVKKAGKCVARPHGRPAGKLRTCNRWFAAGSFSHRDTAGANHFHFSGRVGRHALAPGRYRLRAVASLHGMESNQVQARFRVKKP